jgi:formamidopyrimidine-DNA glycosylase
MPELPEVETIANGVNERVRGAQIVSVWTSGKPQTFKSPEAEIEEVLTGATIARVRRVGKTIVVSLQRRGGSGRKADSSASLRNDKEKVVRNDEQNVELLVHLGMTGRLLVAEGDVPLPPHTHAVLALGDGREVRFVDPRRFGRLSVVRETYAGPGVEPTTIGEAEFAALFKGRKIAIKAALLNQSLLHGVGNIYADESLFRAWIRPTRQAGKLTKAELERLRLALQRVLARAIKLGGSSVSDYVDAEGMSGYFQIEHQVYGRGGKACTVCGTAIRKIVVGGRGTHYCSRCQR